jgi:hypothetical protein
MDKPYDGRRDEVLIRESGGMYLWRFVTGNRFAYVVTDADGKAVGGLAYRRRSEAEKLFETTAHT